MPATRLLLDLTIACDSILYNFTKAVNRDFFQLNPLMRRVVKVGEESKHERLLVSREPAHVMRQYYLTRGFRPE